MARVAIPVLEVTPHAWLSVASASAWATGAAASDYEWAAQDGDILLVYNKAGAGTETYTILRPANKFGRGADYTSPAQAANAVAFHVIEADGWISGGKVQVDTVADGLRFCVLRPKPRL